MSALRIVLIVAWSIGSLVAVGSGIIKLGWRRFMSALIAGTISSGMCAAIPAVFDLIGGRTAGWVSLLLVIPAAWLGRTPLGLLNFLVLQWFGVRVKHDPYWRLDRWIWPLTGWWSQHSWIARRSS